ncbi:hypothetical protein BO70DRAFT_394729 [Aspergillus heteromorphus CBS 117.55]|uniref:Uncharacterized protein n=1 Tax=Aspergillus heteromorphus CBS 117.55 TaxID=1448321 RepID=A0A317WLZ9_9EURO|nr:uncharacterized protein BO70DRAFT_394729 [Aspergillus heteromorphus CBS 117.55]PWY86711.1 hypothetical protein BO70DRAFT_394729 [Aspergillus heteromorphus CBS 117.55]
MKLSAPGHSAYHLLKLRDDLPVQPTEKNAYTPEGSAGHNIVVVCLASGTYGIISAPMVVTKQMLDIQSIQYNRIVSVEGQIRIREKGETFIDHLTCGQGDVV